MVQMNITLQSRYISFVNHITSHVTQKRKKKISRKVQQHSNVYIDILIILYLLSSLYFQSWTSKHLTSVTSFQKHNTCANFASDLNLVCANFAASVSFIN